MNKVRLTLSLKPYMVTVFGIILKTKRMTGGNFHHFSVIVMRNYLQQQK